ncbi:hypothetical protein AQ860_11320 [Burkholderia pseudomallei]|nr:hypothetical protein AQ760_17535 [Burkholderia pseudomallei]OMZ16418.1 hypothetical protein AQ859_13065 [Burkholderia pseudomallei]OMZ37306.1 hypothetical protein AQ860_11320 [Burkholderia pseudomallei]
MITYLLDGSIKQAKIYNHASFRVRFPTHKDLSMIRVTVDASTPFLIDLTMQSMSGIKEESLA